MKENRFDMEYSEEWTSKGETIKTYDISDTGKVAIAFSNSKIGVFDESMDMELVHMQYYTMLKRTSEDEEEVVLYSSTKKPDGVLSGILLISTFLLLCALFLVIIIVTIVRKEKEKLKNIL